MSTGTQIRRLYVVGAGASCPYGLPTLKTLTWELYDYLGSTEREILRQAIYESLAVRLQGPEDSPKCDFEELLNRWDARSLHYVNQHGIHRPPALGPRAAEIALSGLREFLRHKCSLVAEKEGPYDHLVRSLTEHDAIVSFNWDVLLELAFKRSGKEFAYIEEWQEKYPGAGFKTTPSEQLTYLLKPHGSINWFALLDRQLLTLDTRTNWGAIGGRLVYCLLFLKDPLGSRELGSSTLSYALASTPAIVPPSAARVLSVGGTPADGFVHHAHELAMNKIWEMFAAFVSVAEELIVIGYSLPGSDAASILVLKGFAHTEEAQAGKRVMIVNRDDEIVARYQTLVHPGAHLISSDFSTFDPAKV